MGHCPANGDLRNASALEAMLAARVDAHGALIILILGWYVALEENHHVFAPRRRVHLNE